MEQTRNRKRQLRKEREEYGGLEDHNPFRPAPAFCQRDRDCQQCERHTSANHRPPEKRDLAGVMHRALGLRLAPAVGQKDTDKHRHYSHRARRTQSKDKRRIGRRRRRNGDRRRRNLFLLLDLPQQDAIVLLFSILTVCTIQRDQTDRLFPRPFNIRHDDVHLADLMIAKDQLARHTLGIRRQQKNIAHAVLRDPKCTLGKVDILGIILPTRLGEIFPTVPLKDRRSLRRLGKAKVIRPPSGISSS